MVSTQKRAQNELTSVLPRPYPRVQRPERVAPPRCGPWRGPLEAASRITFAAGRAGSERIRCDSENKKGRTNLDNRGAAAAPAAAAAVAVAVGWRWLSGRSQPRSQHGGSALLELELMSLTDKADEVVPFGPSRVGQNGLVWSERFGP